MGDGGPTSVDQREIVDASYLTLVRFGLRPADDPAITNTLGVVDEHLKVDTPNGPFWRRFNHDGYGERPAPAASGTSPSPARAPRSAEAGRS